MCTSKWVYSDGKMAVLICFTQSRNGREMVLKCVHILPRLSKLWKLEKANRKQREREREKAHIDHEQMRKYIHTLIYVMGAMSVIKIVSRKYTKLEKFHSISVDVARAQQPNEEKSDANEWNERKHWIEFRGERACVWANSSFRCNSILTLASKIFSVLFR